MERLIIKIDLKICDYQKEHGIAKKKIPIRTEEIFNNISDNYY